MPINTNARPGGKGAHSNAFLQAYYNTSPIDQFRLSMQAAGIPYIGEIIVDGYLHRFSTNGKRGDTSGYYILYLDGVPAGAFGCWRLGIKMIWRANIGRNLTDSEKREQAQRIAEMKREREAETRQRHEAASKKASFLWSKSMPIADPTEHPYLLKKQIKPHGARINGESLVIPIYDQSYNLVNLQFIDPEGNKRFLFGGRKRGCFYILGDLTDSILICEGFATGVSLHEHFRQRVIVAFDAGNLLSVTKNIRELLPDSEIIIGSDNDVSGIGQTKAREAALSIRGKFLIPPVPGQDWNDYLTGGSQYA